VPKYHGLEPSVSIAYESSRGDGTVGPGWQLQGGSLITRTGPRGGTPRDDRHDRYAVDGADLACRFATGASAPSTCVTDPRDFSRFRFDGDASWRRTRADGAVLTYDRLTDARWGVSRVRDPRGNEVR